MTVAREVGARETAAAPRSLALAALIALILLKLALLLAIGPLTSPDTGGYAAIADAMRHGGYWGRLDLHATNSALLTARAPGYPALLALAHRVAGTSGAWLLALLQIALGVAAAVALHGFARALLGNAVAALLVTAAYATSLPLVLDQTLLTDGPYASLMVIFLAHLGRCAIQRTRVPSRTILLLGLLPAAGLLLRESTTQVMVTVLPLIACFLYAVRPGVLPRLAVFILLLLPLAAVNAGVSAFNAARSGASFLSTGLRTALLVPLVQMEARGAPVFQADDPVVRALRQEIKEWRNAVIYDAVTRTEQRLGITPVEMAKDVRGFFLRSIAAYPGVYASVVLTELRPRYFALSVAPAASLGTLIASRGGALVSVSQSIPTAGAGRLLTLGVYGATALVAGLCWLAMVPGLPLLALARARRGFALDIAVLLALAAFHVGLLLLYAMVHIEARYLIPAEFVPPLALAYLLLAWRRP